MKKLIIAIFALTIVLVGCSSESYTNIGKDEYIQMVDNKDDYVFIDVRTNEEFQVDGIDDTFINIDSTVAVDLITSNYNEDQNIVLVCRSGNRSGTVAKELVKAGFTNVYNIEDGIYSIL